MAKKKINKRTRKKIFKGVQKHPFLSFIAFVLVLAVGLVYLHWSRTITLAFLNDIIPQKQEEPIDAIYTDDEIQFHFLEHFHFFLLL